MSASAGSRFLGGLLIAAGGLIAALSGLCSLTFVAATLGQAFRGPGVLTNLLGGFFLVAIVGGTPFAIGAALVIAGRAVLRTPPTPAAPPQP